jgi:hypothetical protein
MRPEFARRATKISLSLNVHGVTNHSDLSKIKHAITGKIPISRTGSGLTIQIIRKNGIIFARAAMKNVSHPAKKCNGF